MKKFLILLLIGLAGCSDQQVLVDQYEEYLDANIDIGIPDDASIKIDRGDGSYSFGTKRLASMSKDPSDYYILVDSQNISSCDPYVIGTFALDEVQSKNISLHYGKPPNAGTEDFYAPVNEITCSPTTYVKGEEITDVSYMLCSEYNQKVAVVCLMLHQDNQALAKDIFSSFRWVGAEEETEQLLKEVGL